MTRSKKSSSKPAKGDDFKVEMRPIDEVTPYQMSDAPGDQPGDDGAIPIPALHLEK